MLHIPLCELSPNWLLLGQSMIHIHASDWMDITVADFIFSNGLPISLVKCTKFHQQLIECSRFILPLYSFPYHEKISGDLLVGNINQYDKQIESLLKQSKTFGIALFGLVWPCLVMVLYQECSTNGISWLLIQITHVHCLKMWGLH